MTRLVTTVAELRATLAGESAIGLVPTMGALHAGHRALIARSAAENARTVVSLFVNPTQFNDPSDLQTYPRPLDADLALAGEAGADLVFAPAVETVYPAGFATTVEVGGLSERWEGAARPGHFRAVATVVAILLNAVRPTRSYFGEKDFQQLAVIRRLHRDLLLPGEIVGCPTVRDHDGLALSSRNSRLSPGDRAIAATIPAALARIPSLACEGQLSTDRLLAAGRAVLAAEPAIALDYLAIVDPATLEPIDRLDREARLIIAVTLGGVRLIDNLALAAAGAEQ